MLLIGQEEKERVTNLETRIMAMTGSKGLVLEGRDEESSGLLEDLLRQRGELNLALCVPASSDVLTESDYAILKSCNLI